MIPKIIHYVWVGNQEKPELVLKCIESWKKYCPDYKIIEWNNEALKQINNLYVSQAFENRKWAFVSDYLRLYALNKHGGIYCDTDLEITQNIDKFLENDFFTGYEKWRETYSPITALMGAKPHHPIINDLLNEYQNIPFIKNDIMDQTTNTARISLYFAKYFQIEKPYNGNNKTVLAPQCIIYPSYFFCTPENDRENYSIHHFNGSWLEPYSRQHAYSFLKYKIIQFKKNPGIAGDYLPLLKNEQKIFEFDISTRKKICIVKDIAK